jgi:hypothetical protein
MNTNKDF